MAVRLVSPFRAVLFAHFQATWNRSAKEMGKSGRLVLVLALGSLIFLAILPLAGVSALGGFAIGKGFDHWSAPVILASVLAFVPAMVGIISGILGGTKALQWESYRTYPLSLRQIFSAELVAGIGDPMPAVAGFGLLCLCLGLSAAHPSLLPLALLLWLQAMLWMLLLQHLVGSLAAALMKRLKLALILFGMAFWILSVMTSMVPQSHASQRGQHLQAALSPERLLQIKQAGRMALDVLQALPSSHATQGLTEVLRGAWLAALLHQLAPLAILMLALVLVARQMEREADPQIMELQHFSKSVEKLWTFRTPAMGLAKLHWKTIMGSQLGRFGLLMPVMTIVLLKGPFAHLGKPGFWALPGAFGYLALAGSQMQYNQFGLDGHGVKALLLLPIRSSDILLGKLGGMAMYQGLQAGIMILLFALLLHPGVLEILAALCLAGCFFFVQMGLGHWTSCWLPRAMPRSSLKSGSLPVPVVLIGIGTGLLNFLLFGGTFLLCSWKAPWLLLPVMAGLLAGCALAYWLLLPTFETYLDQRREKLVEALG